MRNSSTSNILTPYPRVISFGFELLNLLIAFKKLLTSCIEFFGECSKFLQKEKSLMKKNGNLLMLLGISEELTTE